MGRRACGVEYFNGNPRRPAAAQRGPPAEPGRQRRPEWPALAWAASASNSALAWLTLSAAALRAASRAASRSAFHCFTPLFAGLIDLGAGLTQFGGILGGPGLGLGNGFLRILDGALGAGAALFQRGAQRALNQKLVSQNQYDEQQHRGHGIQKKSPELLNDFLHGWYRFGPAVRT